MSEHATTSDTDTSDEEARAKVAEILDDAHVSMVTSTDADGRLVARPMAHQQVEGDADLWYFTDRGSRLVQHVTGGGAHVNVTVSERGAWVSVDGTAVLVDDVATKRELWNSEVEAWLPEGPEDPGVALVRVEAETGQFWASTDSRVATLVSYVTSKVKGERPDIGETQTVDL